MSTINAQLIALGIMAACAIGMIFGWEVRNARYCKSTSIVYGLFVAMLIGLTTLFFLSGGLIK